jgi:hypothetical protein
MDRRPIKYGVRRDTGIRWDRWNRKVTMHSLQLMVMNGVVRSAEIDPPRYRAGRPDVKAKTTASQLSRPPVDLAGQGWFTKLFRRRADVPIHHVRHTT